MAGAVQIAEQHPIAIYLPLGESDILSSRKIINTDSLEIHRPPFLWTAAFFYQLIKGAVQSLGTIGNIPIRLSGYSLPGQAWSRQNLHFQNINMPVSLENLIPNVQVIEWI